MVDLQTVFYGARLWIWLLFLFSVIAFIGIVLFFFREKIKETWYKVRHPEKVIKVIMHYPNNMFKIFWRLIPVDKQFSINKLNYLYNDKIIERQNDIYAKKTENALILIIEGKKYKLDDFHKIKNRWSKYPEIHYFFNCPNPISYNSKDYKIDITSNQFSELKENDLVSKLLSLSDQDKMLMMLLIFSILNFIASVFIILKIMGVLDKK